VEGGG
jgi:hypothetical protein